MRRTGDGCYEGSQEGLTGVITCQRCEQAGPAAGFLRRKSVNDALFSASQHIKGET
jgi:hypothetical protein